MTEPQHPCARLGCTEPAIPCYLDDDLLAEPQRVTEYLCPQHAIEAGYCGVCGRFFAGTDEFDIHCGFCDVCWDQMQADAGACDEGEEEDFCEEQWDCESDDDDFQEEI